MSSIPEFGEHVIHPKSQLKSKKEPDSRQNQDTECIWKYGDWGDMHGIK